MLANSPILQPLTPEDQAPITQTDMQSDSANDLGTTWGATFNKGALDEPIAVMQSRLQKYDLAANDSNAKTLATLSAIFSGNFEPLMRLEEQKRKTKVANALMPEAVEINRLTSQGKWEDALDRATELGTVAGARVPELAPFYQDITKRIVDKQQTWERMKSMHDMLKSYITDPEDPRQPMLKAMGVAVKDRTPMSEAMLNQFYQQSQLKTQRIDNIINKTSEATGLTSFEATPTAMKQSEVQNPIGYDIMEKYNLNSADLTNVLNGRLSEVKGMTPEKAAEISNVYKGNMSTIAALEIGKLVPKDPTTTLAAMQAGASPLNIATGNLGGPKGAKSIQDLIMQRQTEQVIAQEKGKQESDVFLPAAKGFTPVVVDPSRNDYLTPMGPMSYNEARQTGGKVDFVATENFNKYVVPMQKAIAALQNIPLMFKERQGDPNAPFPLISSFVAQQVGNYAGIPLNDNITVAKAAELTVRRAIEQMEQTGSITEKAAGELKKLMTGAFAREGGAVEASQYMIGRMREEMQKAVGGHIVPDSAIPKSVKEYNPNPAAQQVPGVQQTPNAPVQAAPTAPKQKLKMKW